jgi:LysM repeat protein
MKKREKVKLYKVQKGDTLYKISRKFKASIEEIKTLNVLSSDLIMENQNLRIRKGLV